ncbi:MAG: hypothetical protein WC551_14145 [Patescibacteria group bacterium]
MNNVGKVRGLSVARLPGGTYPIRVVAGERVAVNTVQMDWMGQAGTIYLCWGLKGGTDFNNGAGLEQLQFASAPISVPDSRTSYTTINRTVSAPLTIIAAMRSGVLYDTFIWLSTSSDPSQQAIQSNMVQRDSGGALIDVDGGVVSVDVLVSKARNLNVAYAKV